MRLMMSESLAIWLFVQWVEKASNKENIKAAHHWPIVSETTNDQWIPLTKGQ